MLMIENIWNRLVLVQCSVISYLIVLVIFIVWFLLIVVVSSCIPKEISWHAKRYLVSSKQF